MKFIISQTEFSRALAIVGKSLSTKTNLPVLSNVLLTSTKNRLELLTTNLETATRVVVNCSIKKEGKVTVVGRSLAEFISQLPEQEIVFEQLGEELLIQTENFNARLPTIPAEDFPAIPKIEKGQEIRIAPQDFVRGCTRVAFCASQDEGRPVLTGVLFEFGKDKLSMVATDGYRLGYEEVNYQKQETGQRLKAILPAKTVTEIARIIGENLERYDKGDLSVLIADSLNQVNFKIGDVELTSRLIEGEFPNWQKIIPATFATKIKVSKIDFIRLVRLSSVFAREANNIVKLNFGQGAKGASGQLEVSAVASQVGSSQAKANVEMTGKGGEIAFNFRYLLEVLSAIEDDEVYFEMIESLNPIRITSTVSKENFFHIIMPVRLQG